VDTDYFPAGCAAVRNIFDGIATYSASNWGARRDSIHCFSGASGLTDGVWFDLEDADPDRIYTFAPLGETVLERLHELRPWSINAHPSPTGTGIYFEPSVLQRLRYANSVLRKIGRAQTPMDAREISSMAHVDGSGAMETSAFGDMIVNSLGV
jgi:hypothetical protein